MVTHPNKRSINVITFTVVDCVCYVSSWPFMYETEPPLLCDIFINLSDSKHLKWS